MEITYEERIELIELIEGGVPISRACKIIGISRPTAYKWVKRFYDDGLEGLLDRKSKPHSTPNKLSESDQQIILDVSNKYPHMGAGSLSKKLKDKNIIISPPTVQRILIENGRSGQWDRFKIAADIFKNDPSLLITETIQSMENISKYFKYRDYFTDTPGKKVFTWTEYCRIRGTSKVLPFYTFLDMNGMFLSIYHQPEILNRKPWMRQPKWAAEKIGKLAFTDSTVRMNASIYDPNGIPINEPIVSRPKNISELSSDEILNKMNITVRSIDSNSFYNIPFIKDTRSYIKRYLKKPIYDMINYEDPLRTGIKIIEFTSSFVNNYNFSNNITEYPLMSKTPMVFLFDGWYVDILTQIIDLVEQPLAKKKETLKRLELIKSKKY